MPMYDRLCDNGHELIDCYEPININDVACTQCGAQTKRAWLSKSSSVIGDECDVIIKHGICWPDGTPRRYTSKQEMKDEAKRRGLRNQVEHVVNPKSGSDKSPHTTRWV